jgi:ATP-dependent exoDNAse (exonuclease V) beta subunit
MSITEHLPYFPGDKPNPEQKAIVDQIDDHMVVSAGAGTGKTWTLSRRYIHQLMQGLNPDQIVAITFTKKAAQEMRGRIRQAIGLVEEAYREEANLAEADVWKAKSDNLEQAVIATIHSFFAEWIRQHPMEAGVDPAFTVMEETEAAWALDEAMDQALKKAVEQGDLHLLLLYRKCGSLKQVKRMIKALNQQLHIHGLYRQSHQHLFAQTKNLVQAVAEQVREQSASYLTAVDEAVGALLKLYEEQNKPLPDVFQMFIAVWQANRQSIAEWPVLVKDQENWLDMVEKLNLTFGSVGLRHETVSTFKATVKAAVSFWQSSGIDDDYVAIVEALLATHHAFEEAYEQAKKRRNALDFNDLEKLAYRLSRNETVVGMFRRKTRFLMLDESQDTNPVQMKIIRRLIGPGDAVKLFAVGDAKQSIYRFRGAEVSEFIQLQQQYNLQPLSTNFRTVEPIIAFVNALFNRENGVMAEQDGSPPYCVPYDPLQAHRSSPEEIAVEWLMDCYEGEQEEQLYPFNHHEKAMPKKEAFNVAKRIRGIVDEGNHLIVDETGGRRPAAYRDIAILLRSRTHLPLFEEALSQSGIPYQVAGGKYFYQQREIRDIQALFRLLVEPRDPLALAAVLRSPLGLLNDETLYGLAVNGGFVNAFYDLPDKPAMIADEQWRRVLSLRGDLSKWQRQIRVAPVYEVMGEIVAGSHWMPSLLLGGNGQQRVLNVKQWLDVLEALELDKRLTPWQLLSHMERLAEEEGQAQAEVMMGEHRGVTILTVHAAKGLEFPVVIVPELYREGSQPVERIWIEPGKGIVINLPGDLKAFNGIYRMTGEALRRRELEEEKRLFYVALTRARDYLILSSIKKRRRSPKPETEGGPSSSLFWLLRCIGQEASSYEAVYDQLREQGSDEGQAVLAGDGWQIRIRVDFPDLQSEVLQEETASVITSEEIEQKLSEWSRQVKPSTARPAFEIYSFSMLRQYEQCPRQFYFKRFEQIPESDAVPTIMADGIAEEHVDISPEHSAAGLPAVLLGSIVHRSIQLMDSGLSDEEAFERSTHAFGLDWLSYRDAIMPYLFNYQKSRFYGLTNVWTEEPFHVNLAGHMLEGFIDKLMMNDDGSYSIVDYKTNAPGGRRTKEDIRESLDAFTKMYAPQLQLYGWAVEQIKGKPVKEAVLLFLHPELDCEVSVSLDAKDAAVHRLAGLVAEIETKETIEQFPKHEGKQCFHCGYRDICGMFA